jgi:alkylation response protein AidB-like acyl-CoA dehydrogenase
VSSSTADPTVRPAAGQEVSEREARQVAEAARETEWKNPSFVKELFLGNVRMDLIDPFPAPAKEDGERGEEFLRKLEAYLRTVDAEKLDREYDIPEEVLAPLREMGAFGMKIPKEYGGLGFTQRTYNRAIALCASHGTTIGTVLSAHQSIGVPQPLVHVGTPEQKAKYLPRLAAGAISAFALTETGVGSDPARMSCTAEPTEDGEAYILNGEKLWCTNGPVAELFVVMARTPATEPGKRSRISAFIVERGWEGVEVTHRCSFLGLAGIKNCALRFTNVRIPKENLLWGEGKGLKLALMTLNTGRLGIPWTCAAAGKWCLRVAREWAAERRQWGLPIAQHEAVAQKIGKIAADTFAMQAIAELCSALADNGNFDIRLEVAVAKLFNSETGWHVVDDTLQIRGGRGYETAESLRARGEAPIGVERALRNMRINRIFEGSSEIMRLFIAREAVDPHLQRAGAVADADASVAAKARDSVGLAAHMATWLGGTLVSGGSAAGAYGELGDHIKFAEKSAKKLARTIGMAMARFGAGLERRQGVLFRLVDIGADLFAMSAACAYANRLVKERPQDRSPIRLADLFCRHARARIDLLFEQVFDENDKPTYDLAQDVVKGDFAWLEQGIIEPPSPVAGAS